MFIPAAEKTRLIAPLTRFVLGEACTQARRWQLSYPADPPLMLSVNISGTHLRDPELATDVERALDRSGLAAASLILELSETALALDNESARGLLQLKELGVQLAIDDFGAGHTSLAYLRSLPIDIVKIDKSLIHGMDGDARERHFVKTIIQLGNALGLQTVAEGVEHASQRSQLRDLGCPMGQGFYFGKPLNRDATETLLHTNKTSAPHLLKALPKC